MKRNGNKANQTSESWDSQSGMIGTISAITAKFTGIVFIAFEDTNVKITLLPMAAQTFSLEFNGNNYDVAEYGTGIDTSGKDYEVIASLIVAELPDNLTSEVEAIKVFFKVWNAKTADRHTGRSGIKRYTLRFLVGIAAAIASNQVAGKVKTGTK